jgi:hypothetical protein
VSLGKVGLPHLNFTKDNTMTTKTTIGLADLVEKGVDSELLRDMIQHVAQRLMELGTEGLCAAAYGERNALAHPAKGSGRWCWQ